MNLQDLKPGDTHTLKGFILMSEYGGITHCTCELPKYITICEHDLTFTVPEDFNAIAKAVEVVDKELDSLAEEYHVKTAKLKEKKAELLQINYGGAEILDAVQGDRDERS